MPEPQLGLRGRELEEAESGAEATGRGGQFHQPSRAICLRIPSARRSSGFTCGHASWPDHLIRPRQQRWRDRDAKGLGGLEVDDKLKPDGLLDREFGRFRAV